MAWPTLKSPDWVAGNVLTAANLNTLLDALQYLEGARETEAGTLDAVTTAPSGLAVDSCRYLEIGKLMVVSYYFEWDGGTNDGSGSYRVKVPNSATTASAGKQTGHGGHSLAGGNNGSLWVNFLPSATTGTVWLGNTQVGSATGYTTGDFITLNAVLELT